MGNMRMHDSHGHIDWTAKTRARRRNPGEHDEVSGRALGVVAQR